MERLSWFLMMMLGIGLGFSLIHSCVEERKEKQSAAILRCIADEQCDNSNACDGAEFCLRGVCKSTERNPCLRMGKPYCVNRGDNNFSCYNRI